MKVDLSYIFNVSCEKNSKSFFTLKYDELIDGWNMDNSLSTEIHAKEVNFYKAIQMQQIYKQVRKVHHFHHVLSLMP